MILWAKELFRHDGSFAVGKTDLTRAVHVMSDDPRADGPIEIKRFIEENFAPLGSTHPRDPSSWVRNIDVRPNGDRDKGLYVVTVQYSNAPLSKEEQDKIAIPNPMERPAILEGSRIVEAVPCIRDRYNEAYETAADVPFDPPASKESSRLQLSFKKCFDNVPNWWFYLGDTINEQPIWVGHSLNRLFPRRAAKFVPLNFSEQLTEKSFSFVEVRWMLDIKMGYRTVGLAEKLHPKFLDEQFTGSVWDVIGSPIQMTSEAMLDNYRRPVNWDREFANMGVVYKDNDGNLKEFLTKGKQRMQNPQWLSTTGTDKEDALPVPLDKKPLPNYLVRGDYLTANFAVIQEYVG